MCLLATLALSTALAAPALAPTPTPNEITRTCADLIRDALHEVDGIETNVASGYHAFEFLLRGQDLNGTGPGAGARPHTDFAVGEGCTGGNCDRRAAYLQAATDLLVADLEVMFANWAETAPFRAAVTAELQAGHRAMLTGTGILSYSELAGERMRLGLTLNDPEQSHDSFPTTPATATTTTGSGSGIFTSASTPGSTGRSAKAHRFPTSSLPPPLTGALPMTGCSPPAMQGVRR